MGPGDRTAEFMMGWTVGMPMETHLSITRMILGGAFDRLPENLKICFAHGGGAFPALLGRVDNAWRNRSIAKGKAKMPPREYVGRFYVDSAVFDTCVLKLLVDTVGVNRILLGSDYPFPLGEQQIGEVVRSSQHLTEVHKEMILSTNAQEFLGLAKMPQVDAPRDESLRVITEKAQSMSSAVMSWFDVDLAAFAQGSFIAASRGAAVGRHVFSRPILGVRAMHAVPNSSSHEDWFDADLAFMSSPRRDVRQEALQRGRRGFASAAAARNGHVLNFVGGQLVRTEEALDLVCPVSGETRGTVANSSAADLEAAVAAASSAMASGSSWQRSTTESRCAAVARLADLLEAKTEEFAQAESKDTGKPFALARSLDVARSIANLRFFAGFAPNVGSELREVQAGPMQSMSYSHRRPVGIVGIITPWNLPLYLFTWKLAPALVMGNTVVAKPSELTPTTATLLAGLCREAGIPDGVVNIVHGEGTTAGQALVAHPSVAAVSFTGGTTAGGLVATAAAPKFKKLSLELGGKNAAVVFDDCSFEDTVAGVTRSMFLNSGQICLCSSRIFVQKRPGSNFYSRFINALVDAANSLKLGEPQDSFTDMGPLISAGHLDKVNAAVRRAEADGGTVLCGGSRVPRPGFFFPPTLIEGLDAASATAQTEIFGPVATLHSFQEASEVPGLVNNSRYGLAASVWTESLSHAEIASSLNAGTVWVNTWLNRELHMPFGGMKDSGVSREGGSHSLDFYSETSTVCIKRGSRSPLPMPGSIALRGRSFCSTPRPLGRYVHFREAGGLVFTAGIGPRVPETDEVPGGPVTDPVSGLPRDYDVMAQARQCFTNVRNVLESAGCKLSDVVDVQVFLINMRRDFAAVNKVWSQEMEGIQATRTTIAVSDLPPGGRIAVEMKVVACRNRV